MIQNLKKETFWGLKSGLVALGALLIGLSVAHKAYAHGDESRIVVELESNAAVQAGELTVNFSMIDSKKRTVVTDAELSVVHEKKLHVFIFDPALKEFRHEHPEYVDSSWVLKTHLPVTGNYWIWAQGELMEDGEEFAAGTRLKVKSGIPANPMPPVLGNVRSGTDGNSVVTLSNERLVAKKMAMLNVSFSRKDGSAPEITPLLGAPAHVIGVLSDGDTLVHVHPMDHGTPGQLMLHVVFPASGDYRLWVQFLDGGELRTVPLSVTVK